MGRLETCLKEAKSAISGAGPSTGPMLRSQSPGLVRQEHAAWVTAVELARAAARAAAAVAVPARRGRRAGQPVHPREISFTAARRAVIASVRSGAATASLPAALTAANRDAILAAWPAAASRWTGTGTATARPRPGPASRPAGRAWPPAPRQPRSPSASPSPPDPGDTRRPWNRPPPGATARRPGLPVTLRETSAGPQQSQPHQAAPADHAELNGIES